MPTSTNQVFGPPHDPTQIDVAGVDSAMLAAVDSFATAEGITTEDALDRMLVQDWDTDTFFAFAGATLGDSFGGMWWDHDNAGVLTVGVTTRDTGREGLIRGRFTQPSWLVFREVQYGWTELQVAAAVAITATTASLAAQGWEVHVVALREDVNRVVVEAGPVNATSLGSEPPQAIDPRIIVVRSTGAGVDTACSSRLACGSPMRGGVALWPSSSTSGSFCSAGVPVRSVHTGAKGVLTAGHCGTRGTSRYHDGKRLGPMVFSDRSHPLMDVGVVEDTTSNFWIAKMTYHKDTVKDFPLGGWYKGHGIPIGTAVCNSGARTTLECRKTKSGSAQITIWREGRSVTFYNQLLLHGCGRGGDSGSPNYRMRWDNTAKRSFGWPVGIATHASNGDASGCAGFTGDWVSGPYLEHVRNHTGFEPL